MARIIAPLATTMLWSVTWGGTRLQEGRTLRNNRGDNSNFVMPCKELAYLIRTGMHAFTPPDTPANGGKLTTVASRVLQALKLCDYG